MARIQGFSGLLVYMDWPEFRPLIDGSTKSLVYLEIVNAKATADVLTLVGLDGDVAYVCEPDAADVAEWAAVKPGARPYVGPPKEVDGKQVVVTAPNTTGLMTWFCGAGDDPAPTPPSSGRGSGTKLYLDFAGPGSKFVDVQFTEPVELHDGQMFYTPAANWAMADRFDFSAVMPATVPTANPGAGNCNLVPAGGYSVIVPALGDGSHDVDLAAAVPVPAGKGAGGYWDVDLDTGAVSMSTNPGQADWHLLDVPVQSYFLRSMPMGHPLGTFEIDAYKAEWVSERWLLRLSANKISSGAGEVAGWLMLFRRNST